MVGLVPCRPADIDAVHFSLRADFAISICAPQLGQEITKRFILPLIDIVFVIAFRKDVVSDCDMT